MSKTVEDIERKAKRDLIVYGLIAFTLITIQIALYGGLLYIAWLGVQALWKYIGS